MSDESVASHDEIIVECILTCTCNLVLVNQLWKHLGAGELIDIIECMFIYYFWSQAPSMHFVHPKKQISEKTAATLHLKEILKPYDQHACHGDKFTCS